ncbi:hypothetical protein KCP78_08740 [Salmonella enterica subsp. enterica]|nr:hypothetical protein KCP78_08740 [Salmonella enterica subsp. enterica]
MLQRYGLPLLECLSTIRFAVSPVLIPPNRSGIISAASGKAYCPSRGMAAGA